MHYINLRVIYLFTLLTGYILVKTVVAGVYILMKTVYIGSLPTSY